MGICVRVLLYYIDGLFIQFRSRGRYFACEIPSVTLILSVISNQKQTVTRKIYGFGPPNFGQICHLITLLIQGDQKSFTFLRYETTIWFLPTSVFYNYLFTRAAACFSIYTHINFTCRACNRIYMHIYIQCMHADIKHLLKMNSSQN